MQVIMQSVEMKKQIFVKHVLCGVISIYRRGFYDAEIGVSSRQ